MHHDPGREDLTKLIRLTEASGAETARDVADDALALASNYHKLLVLVAEDEEHRRSVLRHLPEDQLVAVVPVGRRMSSDLLEVGVRSRPAAAYAALRDLLQAEARAALVLDHLELLFEPSLRLDPVQALARLSRSRVVVAVWPGRLVDETLVYAEAGHPEFYEHPVKDFTVLVANPPSHLFPDGPDGRG